MEAKTYNTPEADWLVLLGQEEWCNRGWQSIIIDKVHRLEVMLNTIEDAEEERDILLKRCEKQERYIQELEKQLTLLQKTLDLIEKRGE